MKNIIKSVIARRSYDLKDMLKKIDAIWVQGNLTDDERAELITQAQGNAQTSNSVDILAKLEELDKTVRELNNRVKALEDANTEQEPSEDGTEDGTEEPTYPEYVAGKWYYAGDVVSFAGNNYTCIAPDGVVCVWSPDEYPAYWEMETVTAEPPLEETTE